MVPAVCADDTAAQTVRQVMSTGGFMKCPRPQFVSLPVQCQGGPSQSFIVSLRALRLGVKIDALYRLYPTESKNASLLDHEAGNYSVAAMSIWRDGASPVPWPIPTRPVSAR